MPESVSYWDKDKPQSRSRRKCIGKLDPETKQIISTITMKMVVSEKTKRGSVSIVREARSFYGATCLFDRIGEDTNVSGDLKNRFPDSYQQILSLAYCLIMEDKTP